MQIWAADAVGELLTAASFMMVPPNREGIAKSLTHFVQEVMKGNRAAAARQLGIDRDAIGKWMQKTQRPLLESLVNVSFRLGTTLLGLLTGDVTSDITIEKTSTILEKKVKRPYRKLNKVSLQDLLEAALEDTSAPPRPLTEIAQSLVLVSIAKWGCEAAWQADVFCTSMAEWSEKPSKRDEGAGWRATKGGDET